MLFSRRAARLLPGVVFLLYLGCAAPSGGVDADVAGPKADRWSAADARSRVRIGTWNIQRLGHQWNPDRSDGDAWSGYDELDLHSPEEQREFRDEVYDKLAQIIDENFDLILINEVKHHAPRPHPFEVDAETQHIGDALLRAAFDRREAGGEDSWRRIITSERRPLDDSDPNNAHAEYYAFYYRETRVAPCDDWPEAPLFTDDDPGPLSDSDIEALCDGNADNAFQREPAFACFEAGEFDFVLAGFHASYFEGSYPTIRCEVASLGKTLESMRKAAERANADDEADFMIIGDFNLDHFFADRKQEQTILPGPTELNPEGCHDLAVGAACDRTRRPDDGLGSTLRSDGQRTENLFDHLVVANPASTTELEGDAEVMVHTVERYFGGDGQSFFELASDHLPLVATFGTERDDD